MISLEPPKPYDKWVIFDERNQILARKNSKSSQKIHHTTHDEWYINNYLKITMLIHHPKETGRPSIPVGYIHIQRHKAWATLSILIYQKQQRRGYAKTALNLIINLELDTNWIAEVLPHNTASHHLFSDCGFIQYAPGLYIHRAESANWSFG